MPTITFSNPATVHSTGGRYNHAAVVEGAHRRVVISGQVGAALDGTIVEGAEAQIEQAFRNLGAVLATNGMSASNVVKTTAFLTDRAHLPAYRDARRRLFGDNVSASTLLFVAGLADPKYVFEIEAEAVA